MPWKFVSAEDLAKSHGLDYQLIRQKMRLVGLIKKARKSARLTQADLAKRVGVTQGRIAQIETGMGGLAVTLEILLGILKHLGYEYRIVAKKAS